MEGVGGGAHYNPRTVEEVFRDFKGRRAGMIKALTTENPARKFFEDFEVLRFDSLWVSKIWSSSSMLVLLYVVALPGSHHTTDMVYLKETVKRNGYKVREIMNVEEFYQQCDPEKENLCLYGFPSEQWEVNLPAEEVPPELPEPALGINFARDGMQEKDWLSLVAVHSDAWLLSVAFYFGARFGFDKADRKKLHNMINDLPTIYEVVTGAAKKHLKEKPSGNHGSSNRSKSNSRMRGPETQVKQPKSLEPKDEDDDLDEEDEDEHGETLCGACGENYASDEFWICCDICEKWFHGKCVKITPARAEHIKQYKCPSCSNKRSRP
ncbi:hypothetical protein G4B88_022423 [Cannabis sativa]|uniref:PHD finger protein ALFIN-LIKE n=1 Tax=Cannabis sativa TaxID=3483 RepID=A0A7J6HY56_CANSA|nr:hypothetical protein G4B88_022423 [Cannabis sativa]